MSSWKITLPAEVSATNPVEGDLFLAPARAFRLTETLAEEVAQQLYIRLKMFLGEWFLDGTIGTPWFQSILGIKAPVGIVSQILRSVVAKCPGVAQVTQFSITPLAQRKSTITFTVKLIDGTFLTSAQYGPFVVGPGG